MSAEETAASRPSGKPGYSAPHFVARFGWGLLGAGLLALPLSDHLRSTSADPASPLPLRFLFWLVVGFCGFLVVLLRLSDKQHAPVTGRGERLVVLGIGGAAGSLALLESFTLLPSVLGTNVGRPELVLRWVGLVSVVVGAVLAAVFPTRGARPRGRRPLLGFVSGVLAVLVVASASWVWAVGRSVWHTTAAAVDPGPVPSTVHEVAWTWEPPRGVELWNVLPTASGAVAVLDDGVIGLDTATGEERWHYRRPGTGVAANVTPDGKTVVLTFRITDYRLLGDGNRREALLALDAATGRVLGDGLVPPESPPLGASWTDAESWPDLYVGGLTADALITWPGTEELRSLGALDLRTGEMRWTADTDPDCRIPSGRTIWWLRTLPDTVLLPQLCSENGGETARITAFDADSGEHRWVHEQPVPGQRGYRWLVVAGHHAPFGHPRGAGRGNGERPNSPVVVVAWDGDSGHLVLDSATGEVLADGADHATGCGGLAHYTAETVAVLCPGEVEQTLRLEKRTLDGDAVAGVEIPTRLGFDTLGAEPLSTAEVDWLSLAGAGVAVWGYQTPDGQSRLEAYVAEWDGDVRTIALPDTGRSWTRLRSVPGAVLAYANESREVVGLR